MSHWMCLVARRGLATVAPRRFFRRVGVVQSGPPAHHFEITLDQRKLKSPAGNLFKVPSEGLAQAVAAEWDMQQEFIQSSFMHITGLCNTALDSTTGKDQLVDHLIDFLHTDTLTCRMDEPPELARLQSEEWDPIVSWFNSRFESSLSPSSQLMGPEVPACTVASVWRHLSSYSAWCLHGLNYATETTKSLVLVLAALERRLSTQEAARLCRLETEFQTRQWGSVAWAHGLEEQDTVTRLSAAILFVHLSATVEAVRRKETRSNV